MAMSCLVKVFRYPWNCTIITWITFGVRLYESSRRFYRSSSFDTITSYSWHFRCFILFYLLQTFISCSNRYCNLDFFCQSYFYRNSIIICSQRENFIQNARGTDMFIAQFMDDEDAVRSTIVERGKTILFYLESLKGKRRK